MPLPASDRTVEWLSSELRDRLVRKLSRRGAGHADAEDAYQRALVALLTHRDELPPDREGDQTRRMRRLRLGKWLEVVAGRFLARSYRLKNRETILPDPNLALVSSPLGDGAWIDGYRVRELLDRMDQTDREILVLRGVGYDLREIGAKLGITEEAASKRLQRARHRFGNALEFDCDSVAAGRTRGKLT
jgi:DNA-directed RNA polymerase specialized sigma24 family protein